MGASSLRSMPRDNGGVELAGRVMASCLPSRSFRPSSSARVTLARDPTRGKRTYVRTKERP